MAKRTKKETEKSQEDIRAEIKKFIEKAEQITPKQLKLPDLEEEDVSFDTSIFNDTADPDKSYRLYYGIMRLLKENLPKDKKIRRYVYDEKNLYLNRGKEINEKGIRGSDGRMTYLTPFLEKAFQVTADWVKSGANPFNIYEAFFALNVEQGFREKK